MALIAAIGIMTVLAITGTTLTYYATANARTASRSGAGQSAYALAETGVADALSVLENALDPRTGTLLPQTVVNLNGGTATYSGTIDSNYVWTITSVGQARNPAGGSPVKRTLHRSVTVQGINDGANGMAWSRFYQDDASSCLTIDTVVWTASVSTRGGLCLDNGATIIGTSTTVDVGGNVVITGPDTNSSPRAPSAASGWTNSTNIFTSNNVYATNAIGAGATGATLNATGFGFAIPSSAIIRGVSVSIERKAGTASTIKDNSVYLLKASAQTGTNQASASYWPTADASAAYGATNSLWGATLTAADVNNSGFGVRVIGHNFSASSVTASIDYISITVTYTNDTAAIGTSGTPVQEVNVNGTCKYNGAAAHSPCSSADKVYGTNITTVGQNLTMPQVDYTWAWANAKPGPKHFCTNANPGLASNFFDTDASTTSAPNHSIPGNGEMTPTGSDYTCQVVENGTLKGELSWNHTTHILTIYGTVFIDGDFRFDDDGQVIHYLGRGDIYSGGHDEIDELVCAGGSGTDVASSCWGDMSNWDPAQNMLVLLSMENNEYDQGGSSCSPSGTSSCPNGHPESGFQGILYSTADCLIHEQFRDSGPVICNTISLPSDSDGWPTYYPYPVLSTVTDGQKYSNTATATHFELTVGPSDG